MSSRVGWEQVALRWLQWISVPASAGLAFCCLSLGAVTWLPALAATAQVLHRWREDGDERAFLGVFADFRNHWRRLWRHSLISTAIGAVLTANLVFLLGRGAVGFVLLAVQLGLAAAFIVYHLAFAAAIGHRPTASLSSRRHAAIHLAFGSWRGALLLLATVLVIALTAPLGIGPLLFGPSVPLLAALSLQSRLEQS
ncbi:DUF624 domain-containing protein [Kribbella qitaiheensis]|uniref:DUF624 domain-containing protein n=1 Tax=Kribbella qitaiheensis TaxID=1544730 RepID=A0A7G6WUI6_9ACTN|nr:DUF624 domain-containing protein [Kribbella qitaiheensis]QNE17651.1 DUF624 domain-containing protein [Kribbella qitaiheensis]